MKREVAIFVLTAAVAACHHAPPPQPAPATVAAPSAPADYQDTAAKWAGLKPRPDSATSTGSVAPAVPDSTNAEWQAASLAIGDGVFIVRAHYGGRVYIGAGDATQTMTLVVDADAVNDFVAETRVWLPPKKPRRDQPPPALEEPKSGRTMSFGRHFAGGQAHYRFFFSDDRQGGFSLPATLTETKAILAGLTRGAALARQVQTDHKSP